VKCVLLAPTVTPMASLQQRKKDSAHQASIVRHPQSQTTSNSYASLAIIVQEEVSKSSVQQGHTVQAMDSVKYQDHAQKDTTAWRDRMFLTPLMVYKGISALEVITV
jgi:hypothetical protein